MRKTVPRILEQLAYGEVGPVSGKTPVLGEVWMAKGGGRHGYPKRPSRLWTVRGTGGRGREKKQ